jgi:carbon monoxide dehydrogenase subunit G
MYTFSNKVVINVPIEKVWAFLSSMDDWHRLIPGYISHEIEDSKVSTWLFKSHLGLIKKKMHLKAEITDWKEYEKINLNIIGISDKISGKGFIETLKISNHKTMITVYFDVILEGSLAKLIKPLLKKDIEEIPEKRKMEIEQILNGYA